MMSPRGIQILFCLCLVVAGAHFSSVRTYKRAPLNYSGYRLYEIILETAPGVLETTSLDRFLLIRKNADSIIFLDDVFWAGKAIHVVVAPHKAAEFELIITQLHFKWRVLTTNYKYYVDSDAKQFHSPDNNYNWAFYYKLDDTYNFLKRLQKQNPNVHPFEIGKSAEGRPIMGAHISKRDCKRNRRQLEPNCDHLGPNFDIGVSTLLKIYRSITETREQQKVKPTIFVEAGMHGNKWITSAVATYIINELATSTEPAISMVAKRYNWLILPHVNPDGYVYSGTSDPLWRKTRGRHGHCIGVDPNSNFDVNWHHADNATIKCNQIYGGPNAFSEVETKALADAIRAGQNSIKLYVALHFGERTAAKYSFSYRGITPANATLLKDINSGISGAYVYESLAYGGSSVEWVSKKAGINNAFNFEITRGNNLALLSPPGCQVPENLIAEVAKDVLHSLVSLAVTTVPTDEPDGIAIPPGWK